MIRDLKYLAAYLVPLLTVFSLSERGIYAFTTAVFVFIIIPVVELFQKGDESNLSPEEANLKASKIFYDVVLYFNVPLVYGILVYFLYVFHTFSLSTYEIIGLLLAVGTTLGSAGINVAHELGHRDERFHKILSLMLLIPCQYSHFLLEHNFGHHKNVGTDEDPASAKKNETLYRFWVRSISGSFVNAWNIQKRQLSKAGAPFISLKNTLLIAFTAQLLLMASIFAYDGWFLLIMYVIVALNAILLLETINYVEHYGLRRKRLDNGRYERVEAMHSWNSNHYLGRILLYELTRHSDHHYLANKKYQTLDHHDSAKQLPFGYPMSILISLIPPIWFRVMNPKL